MALPSTRDRASSLGPTALAIIFALALTLAVLPAVAQARDPGPSPFRRGLVKIDAHLRLAIETGPAELAEDLRSSELVCGLGQGAEERGDTAAAAADWSTLHQGIAQIDAPAAAGIDRAFALADADLRALRKTFSAPWSGQPPRLRELNRGVSATLRGTSLLRSAMDRIEAAFPAWEEHRCGAATEAMEAGVQALPAGLEPVNAGVLRLWRLLETLEAGGSRAR